MTVELASNILATGAYFKKRAGRRSSVVRYFFVGFAKQVTGFLKYFKDHAAEEARGAFDLMDLVRANWDGAEHSVTLTQSTKKDRPHVWSLYELHSHKSYIISHIQAV